MKKVLFLIFAIGLFFACKKDNCGPAQSDTEYLIVGYSSCFCVECCKQGFKLTGDNLFAGERVSAGVYNFESAPLDAAKYDIAKVLLEQFPNELLTENGKTYGCNGCADQPVYYVELKKNGQVYHWQIDSIDDGFPDYVKNYSQLLSSVLNQLQ